MLCKYSYLTKNNIVHGDFQADTEDFKKLIKTLLKENNIRSTVVDLQNGEKWIGYMHFENMLWECVNRKNKKKFIMNRKTLRFKKAETAKEKRERIIEQLKLSLE